MLNGYKFRLYPDDAQARVLLGWIGCQRLIYNAKVQEDRYFRRCARRMVGTAGESIPVDQQYSQFITERTAFLRDVPSQVLRNGAVKFRQAYARFFKQLGGRPKFKKRGGRQAVWLTGELFQFLPVENPRNDAADGYQLVVGTKQCPVGVLPYRVHRPHALPASIHLSVDGGAWWLSFAADDRAVTIPGADPDAATERIAEDLRHLSPAQLAARTLGGDRGGAKPLATSDGQVHDLKPVQKTRIKKARRQRQKWQGKAARRKKGSQNQKKAYRQAARYDRYEAEVRRDYTHQTSHQLVANDACDLYAFEALRIKNMTKRPKAQRDAQRRFLPKGAAAKAGLNRAILTSAWGEVVRCTTYKALRRHKLVILVPPAYSSQTCAACGHQHSENRLSQADFLCQHCGHADNADHNAACVIAQRGIAKLLSGDPLTKPRKSVRVFRTLGPERSEVTPGEIAQDARGQKPRVQRSGSQEARGAIPETPASAS